MLRRLYICFECALPMGCLLWLLSKISTAWNYGVRCQGQNTCDCNSGDNWTFWSVYLTFWSVLFFKGSIFDGHDDLIKWKHFPSYWPFVQWINRWPVNSPRKGQWRGAFMFSLISPGANSRDAGDLWCHHAHYDITVMNYHYLCTMSQHQ